MTVRILIVDDDVLVRGCAPGDQRAACAGAVPGSTRIGTWRGGGRRLFVCVRSAKPAVRIETVGRAAAGGRYDGFIVTSDDPSTVAEQIATVRPTAS